MQVNNDDFTGSAPLKGVFQNDFWYGILYSARRQQSSFSVLAQPHTCIDVLRGQQITSDQSHKSYRPVTILLLRLVNCLGQLLPQGHLQLCLLASLVVPC